MARDPDAALAAVAALGCSRVLTSGRAASAADGADLLARLAKQQGGVSVMPGGGIGESNLRALLEATGVREFHASARSRVESGMRYRNEGCSMGSGTVGKEFAALVTDAGKVRRMVDILKEVRGDL